MIKLVDNLIIEDPSKLVENTKFEQTFAKVYVDKINFTLKSNKAILARAKDLKDKDEQKYEESRVHPVEEFKEINIIDLVNFFEQDEPVFWIDYYDKCVTFVSK